MTAMLKRVNGKGFDADAHVLEVNGATGVSVTLNTVLGTLTVMTPEGYGLKITGIKGPIGIEAQANG